MVLEATTTGTKASLLHTAAAEERPLVEHALSLAEEGHRILPLRPGSKTPWLSKWRDRATADAGQIREWWDKEPDSNPGLAMGGGRAVIDMDPRNRGEESLAQLSSIIELPETRTVETGGGGLHLYYLTDPERPIKSRCLDPGLELLGDGKQAVGPGSIHPNGTRYRWRDSQQPLAELPEQLYEEDISMLRKTRSEDMSSLLDSHPPASSLLGVDPGLLSHVTAYIGGRPVAMRDDALRACDSYLPFVEAALRLFGVGGGGIGRSFCCVLPGHEERNPSASLWRDRSEAVVYRDWHRRSDRQCWQLSEVFAAIVSGDCCELNPPELSRWKLRLLHEAGYLQLARVPRPPLPAHAHRSMENAWEGFLLLLGCRWVNEPGEPTPYTVRFAARWCGLSVGQASRAIRWLRTEGFLVEVGRTRRMPLYLPGNVAHGARCA
jgi:hypothetical protein